LNSGKSSWQNRRSEWVEAMDGLLGGRASLRLKSPER
jgi:hypothetical protein